MKKNPASTDKSSLRMVFIFGVCVFLLILLSLSVKTVMMVRQSIFDGNHRFTLVLARDSSVSTVASLDPETNSIDVLQFKQGTVLPVSSVGKGLTVVPDAVIKASYDYSPDAPISAVLTSLLWHFGNIKSDLNFYDLFRFLVFVKGVPLGSQHVDSISLPIEDSQLDKKVTNMFSDGAVSAENVSIQVVNASGVGGLGNRITRVLTNLGCNVVSITSARSLENHSRIAYFGKQTYTLRKLRKWLGYPVSVLERETIADIVITVGQDEKETGRY